MIWPTMWPSALGTTAYCSHLFCTSPPRLRRKIGWLSEEGSVSPGVAVSDERGTPVVLAFRVSGFGFRVLGFGSSMEGAFGFRLRIQPREGWPE